MLTTHYLDEASVLADRVVVLVDGRVIADAAPTVLRARSGAVRVRFELPPEIDASALPPELRHDLDPEARVVAAAGARAAPVLAAVVAWSSARGLDLSTLEVGPPTLEDAYLASTSGADPDSERRS